MTTDDAAAMPCTENKVDTVNRVKRCKARTPTPKPHMASPSTDACRQLYAASVNHLAPWRLHEYPGWIAIMCHLLNADSRDVRRSLGPGGRYPINVRIASTLSTILRQRGQAMLDLAARWDAYLVQREAEKQAKAKYPLRTRRLKAAQEADSPDTWRSTAADRCV